jgi:hypothetical protein
VDLGEAPLVVGPCWLITETRGRAGCCLILVGPVVSAAWGVHKLLTLAAFHGLQAVRQTVSCVVVAHCHGRATRRWSTRCPMTLPGASGKAVKLRMRDRTQAR